MLEMSWITAILQLYSQVADLFGNVIVKRINMRLFDLLAQFHYILNLLRTHNMRKYLTNTTVYISKLQENLQIMSIFDLTFGLY